MRRKDGMSSSPGAVLSVMMVLTLFVVVHVDAFKRVQFPIPRESFSHAPSSYLPPYETYWYEQRLDHFDFSTTHPSLFPQRYLVSTTYWGKSPSDPIFFYAGNEGDIESFYQNSGFMFDIAPEFKALIVFAEHRYFGKTMPYGDRSYELDKVQYLTSEQALADYAELLVALRTKYNIPDAPIIAFGGSYGGMLAAWFRIKYPHIVGGAIAASAPVAFFEGFVDPEAFNRIVTDDFSKSGSLCSSRLRSAFAAMMKDGQSSSGRSLLSSSFHLCQPMTTMSEVNGLYGWLNNGFTYMAMTDYPYPSDFLMPMPAWPVKAACERIMQDPSETLTGSKLYDRIRDGVSVYYNYSAQLSCFNTSQPISPTLSDLGWDYLACTEMVMPIGSNGKDDMFLPDPWNLDDYITGCKQRWGVTPRPYWISAYYGIHDFGPITNIVFSNGNLDPWHAGGILKNLSPSVIAIMIEDGAHHLDLRGSNPADPPSVIAARIVEKENIHKWVEEWNALHGRSHSTRLSSQSASS